MCGGKIYYSSSVKPQTTTVTLAMGGEDDWREVCEKVKFDNAKLESFKRIVRQVFPMVKVRK